MLKSRISIVVTAAGLLGMALAAQNPPPQNQGRGQNPQQLGTQQPPLPPGTGVISGIVVRMGSSEPISGASVELRKIDCNNFANPPETFTATTASDGRFTFQNLRPGGWCIVASRVGGQFVPAEYLQRGYKGRGVTIALTDGQRMQDVRLAMPETGGISGRVLDYDGEPMGHARVQVLEPFYQDGQRRLYILQVVQTNDLGEYRFFWLPPGRYYVAVVPEDTRRSQAAFSIPPPGTGGHREDQMSPIVIPRITRSGDLLEDTYVTIYYPGAADPRAAVPIDVRPGVSVGGIQVSLAGAKVRSWHVRGTVTNGATGQVAANAQIRLFPREWTAMVITPSATANEEGKFDLRGVVPGSYVLYASLPGTGQPAGAAGPAGAGAPPSPRGAPAGGPAPGPLNPAAPRGLPGAPAGPRGPTGTAAPNAAAVPAGPPPVPPVVGRILIDVGGGDIDNLSFTLTPGYSVAGRVVVEGAAADAIPRGVSVNLARDPDLVGLPSATARGALQPTGTFTFPNVGQGDYRVYVQPLVNPFQWGSPNVPQQLENAYVKSIRLGSADVLVDGLHITDAPRDLLEVTIAAGGKVEGRVVNDKQEPVVNATVVLVPGVLQLRRRFDLYRTTSTDSSGRFQVKGVAPGDYKAFAWEEVERDAWQDPEYLRPYEGQGRTFHVGQGESQVVDAVVIPAGSNR